MDKILSPLQATKGIDMSDYRLVETTAANTRYMRVNFSVLQMRSGARLHSHGYNFRCEVWTVTDGTLIVTKGQQTQDKARGYGRMLLRQYINRAVLCVVCGQWVYRLHGIERVKVHRQKRRALCPIHTRHYALDVNGDPQYRDRRVIPLALVLDPDLLNTEYINIDDPINV